jgi:hypothetical protein
MLEKSQTLGILNDKPMTDSGKFMPGQHTLSGTHIVVPQMTEDDEGIAGQSILVVANDGGLVGRLNSEYQKRRAHRRKMGQDLRWDEEHLPMVPVIHAISTVDQPKEPEAFHGRNGILPRLLPLKAPWS